MTPQRTLGKRDRLPPVATNRRGISTELVELAWLIVRRSGWRKFDNATIHERFRCFSIIHPRDPRGFSEKEDRYAWGSIIAPLCSLYIV